MKKHRSLMKMGLLFVVIWLAIEWSWAGNYVDQLKYGEQYVAMTWHASVDSPDEQTLRQQIELQAVDQAVAPIDAKIDRIWKAIPGLNGKEVDIEATLRLAQKLNGSIHWVYQEVPPRVTLEDLGASPIYKGNPHKKMVSLMFNVAWGEEYIPSILETLQKEKVHATFFFDGRWLEKHIKLAKTIQGHGHELSNHGYSHQLMSGLNRAEAVKEILKTEDLLTEHLQVENTLYAPAAGDFNQMTLDIAHEQKLKTVLWTLDTVDWKKPSPETILQRIIPRLEPGAMILMHPTAPTSEALERMIQEIKNEGYTLGTVSELISPRRMDPIEHKFKF